MIFIDDSPFECERVKSALPEVQVEQFPANPLDIPRYVSAIQGVERLGVGDGRPRPGRVHPRERQPREAQEGDPGPGFIPAQPVHQTDDCPAGPDRGAADQRALPAHQPVQPDDQTPRSGRYRALPGRGRRLHHEHEATVFSDYGTIGVAIVDAQGSGDRWEIDSFMLSCRAFGRGVEAELLRALLEDAGAAGVRSVGALCCHRKERNDTQLLSR